MNRLFFKNNKLNFILTLFTLTLDSAAYVGIAFFMKTLMDVAGNRDLQGLIQLLIVIAILLPTYVGVIFLRRFAKNRFLERAARQYKEACFEGVLKKTRGGFQKNSTAQPLSMLTNDYNTIEQNLLGGYFSIWNCLTQLVLGILSMLWLSWLLTIAILLVCMLPILVSMLFTPKLQKMERQVSQRNEGFVGFTKDIFSGFAVIKSFRAEKEIGALFCRNNAQLEGIKRSRRETADLVNLLAEVSSLLVEIVIFTVGALLAIRGAIAVSVLIAFIQLLNNVVGPLQRLSPLLVQKRAAQALVEKAEKLLQSHETRSGQDASFRQQIRVENLTFCYEDGAQPALKNVSCSFEKGKSYAIVGASGSGKSTLLNLLMRQSDTYDGTIRFDETELRKISEESLYRLISTIQQNVFIFDDSIGNNITLYQSFPAEKISRAIRQSGLDGLVREKGEAYPCGENGNQLSGGEKQRISIARGLLRDAPILLMDEATAALDAETSLMVEDAVLSIDGLTRIVVTHKLQPDLLRRYDQILVMDRGMLAETGRYEDLLAERGLFYSLCRLSGIGVSESCA